MKLSEFLVSDYWDFIDVDGVRISRTSCIGFYKYLVSIGDDRVSDGKPYKFRIPYTKTIISVYEDRVEVGA